MEPLINYICLIITGICTGITSGLFGAGGGFLMTPVQYWLYSLGGMESTLATRLAFGTSLAVIVPTMISGTFAHHALRTVNWRAAIQIGISAIFGGFIGGTLATHLPGNVLRLFFALLIIFAAVRMVWHIHEPKDCRVQGSVLTYLPLGFCIGIISGLSGIGGGILLVPALVILLGYPIHNACGTSAASLIFSSIGGVTAYIIAGSSAANLPPFALGYVDILSFLILALVTIPLAQVGVKYARECSSQKLQILFAGLLLLIGAFMLAST
jgi:uncharacterized protein